MEEINIAEKPIKPENCVLAFGIPTSRESFLEDQKRNDKDFAKKFNGIWARYEYEVVSNIQKIEPLLIRLGVTIVHKLTLQKFGELCRNHGIEVIILFSHWNNNAVEFADGFADVPAIINQVPSDFSGLFDLCICHPEKFRFALKNARRNCLVRFTDRPATPYIWLNFYRVLFEYLSIRDISYTKALEEVIITFLKTVKTGRSENEKTAGNI